MAAKKASLKAYEAYGDQGMDDLNHLSNDLINNSNEIKPYANASKEDERKTPSTATATDKSNLRKIFAGKLMSDEEIAVTLKNGTKLKKLKEMIMLNLKKQDIAMKLT